MIECKKKEKYKQILEKEIKIEEIENSTNYVIENMEKLERIKREIEE